MLQFYTNYDLSRRQTSVADNQTINGHDARIEDNCYIIKKSYSGLTQWGNAVYFNMFSIMYLLRNKASAVIIKANGIMPIGTRLTGVVFGPKADSYDENKCLVWRPRLFYREQGAMQDIIDLRNDWDNLTENWPKTEFTAPQHGNILPNMNTNPMIPHIGIEPSLIEAANILKVNWKEVIVLHIRQGDVMQNHYPPNYKFIHSQPPCAYYEDAVETGYVNGTDFPYVLIITNTQEEEIKKNPCAQYLEDRYSSGSYPTKILNYEKLISGFKDVFGPPSKYEFLRIDLHILTEAINLVEGHSTFSMGTNMLNNKLKRHFVPASPSTINCVYPLSSKLNGDYVYTRQYYSKDLIQMQYLLPDWFGFSPTCDELDFRQVTRWRDSVPGQMKKWNLQVENITTKMLDYPRGKLLKYKTSDKPFECPSSVNPLIKKDPSKWFVPCICKEDLIDHIFRT